MKLAMLTLNVFCVFVLATQWARGIQVPAWVALLWCVTVTLQSLEDWLESR